MAESTEQIQNKKQLRQLLVEDELDKLSEALLMSSEASGMEELFNAATVQATNWKQYQKDEHSGAYDYKELKQTRTQIGMAMLGIINDLPNDLPVTQTQSEEEIEQKQKGTVSQRSLKIQIVVLLFISKLIVVIFLLTHWEAGGFTKEQFIGTLTFLVSAFTTHIALAIKDLMNTRKRVPAKKSFEQRESRRFQLLVYGLITAYVVVQLFSISLKPSGAIDYTFMSGLLTLWESSLGVYLATVVMGVFGRK